LPPGIGKEYGQAVNGWDFVAFTAGVIGIVLCVLYQAEGAWGWIGLAAFGALVYSVKDWA
jgi:hypothetical protein